LKQRQWAAFIVDLGNAPAELRIVIDDLAGFLMVSAAAARAVH